MGFVLLLAILGLLVWLDWYLGNCFYQAAKMKGHPERKYFWIPFLLGPIGYLLVIALPDRGDCAAAVSDELPDL